MRVGPSTRKLLPKYLRLPDRGFECLIGPGLLSSVYVLDSCLQCLFVERGL